MFQPGPRSFAPLALFAGALCPFAVLGQTPQPLPGETQDPPQKPAPAPPQQRAQVLREAQSRVDARRRQREQQQEQETYSHRFEVAAGGGYLRFRPGQNLQHNTEAAWNVGFTDWLRPKLGVTADVRGYYGTAITNNFEFQVYKPSVSQYTFMGGPQYRYFQNQHWALSFQGLAGVAHGNFSTGLGSLRGAPVGLWPDGTAFALSAGAPIDYNLGPGLAVRLNPNYLLTNFGSSIQNNLGFTAGVVVRFGRR